MRVTVRSVRARGLVLAPLVLAFAHTVAHGEEPATALGRALAKARADGTLARIASEQYFTQPEGNLKMVTYSVPTEGDVVRFRYLQVRVNDTARIEEYTFDRDGRLATMTLHMGNAKEITNTIEGARRGEQLHLHILPEDTWVDRPCPSDAVPITVAIYLLPVLRAHLPAGQRFPTMLTSQLLELPTTLASGDGRRRPVAGSQGAQCVVVHNPSPEPSHFDVPVWVATQGPAAGTIEGLVYGRYLERITADQAAKLVGQAVPGSR